MNDIKPRAVVIGGTGKTKRIVIGSDSPVSIQTMWKEGIVPVLTDKQALFSLLDKIEALQSVGFETIAAGDSFNDLAMIKASKAGFLFKSTEQIIKDNPSLPAYTEYSELLAGIKNAMGR